MADGFLGALKAVSSFRAKGGAEVDTSGVTWTHALIGMVGLFAVQAVLLWLPFVDLPGEALPALGDLAIVAVLALAVPFAVLGGAAAWAGKTNRLPAAFLFLALYLALLQVVMFILSSFIQSSSGSASMGGLALICFWSGRHMVGLSTGMAVLAAVLVVLGTFGVGLLLLALPTGQALLAA